MADRSNANDDLPRRLTVDAPPPPIPKDMQGSENPIPLSPQWLLPKPVDSKLGILSGEPHSSPHHGYHPEAVSASGNGDSHDAVKRKDVFRSSLYDLDSGRRDRWRDEERETHSANRRDRWREGEKELGDARRTERWSDNSARHLGEGRRAPAERRTDSNNRDNTYDQRRESKWNTRWGPDDKESENRRDKWSDSSRVYEGSRDKGTSQLPIHGQDLTSQGKDTEGEHSRLWRSNSFLARGRGESNLPQTLTPNKQAPPFGYGRGKGENGASVFSAGRGRVDTILTIADHGSSRSYPLGFASERSDGTHSDQFTLKYSRMKLLDIYRMTDLKSHRISLEGFVDVPSLTIAEPLEPLALSAPTSEELATLKGIDKGDIVSSGLPQVSKEGSTGKNSGDSGLSRQPRLGSREDTPCAFGDYRDETSDNIKGDHSSYGENSSCAKYSHPHGLDSKVASSHPYQENKLAAEGEMGAKEVSMLEKSSSHHTTPWRSQSVGERSHGSSVHWQDYSAEARSRTSDMGSMHLQKNLETEQRNSTADSSSYFRDKSQYQNNDLHSEQRNDFKIKRQSSEVMDLGREDAFFHSQEDPYSRDRPAGKLPPSLSPEDLSLYYKDPQGRIQGPFTGSDLIGWFEAGYFGIDLQVRLASAPVDAPFSLLGDVMPHLRAKARPPPGFGAAKQNDIAEVSNTGKFGSLGNAHSAVDEFEAIKNMQRNRHEVGTEAENRFIESLMSGNMNSSPSEHYSYAEGMKGYSGSSTMVENMRDMNYLLAQRISLERHRSLPTAGPYWSDKDVSSVGAKPDMVPEIPSPHAKFLPNVGDASGQIPQSPHHVDFLAMLQAAADKSSSSTLNSAPIWPNMTEVSSLNNLAHGGMDIMKDKVDMHHNQHIASQTGFGAQHQRLHPQAPPSLPHLLGQPIDLLSGVAPPEKLLAPEISQDPQLLSLLQQQYLISQIQLHSQSALPSHLSLLDKYVLLKQQQQQKQEQQQQHLLQQQQQQLLSQVLSASQLQLFGDPSSAHFKASAPAGNASVDRLGIHQIHETLLNNQQMPVVSSLDGHSSNVSNFNLHSPKDVSYTVNTGPSPPHLPHGMLDHSSQPAGWDTNLLREDGSLPSSEPESVCKVVDSSLSAETIDKNAEEVFAEQTNLLDKSSAVSHTKENMASVVAGTMNGGVVSKDAETSNIVSALSEELNDVNISPENVPEKCHDDTPSVKDVKEGKKISEKKTRKKNSKSQLVSKHGKGSSKTISNQQVKPDSETEGANVGGQTTGLQIESEQSLHMATTLETGLRSSVACAAEPLDSHRVDLSSSSEMTANEVGFEGKAEVEEVGMPSINLQTSSNRAWKPAPGLKPKSLLEIQQEEQRRLQAAPMVSGTSAATMPSSSSRTPWAGVVANSEQQAGTDIVQNPNIIQGAVGNPSNSSVTSRIKKSQLHDLLAEEVLAKSKGDTDSLDEKGSSLPPFPLVGVQAEIQSVDDDFIEAKDTKKSRKKASKAAKAAGPKASPPVASAYLSTPLVSAEKSKSTRQTQQEKELLPVMPSGPSLGDFVLWKGDQTNSSPAPAWSTDSTKLQKATSLRDILREQEKKGPSVQQQVQIPTPPKVQSNRGNLGSGSSWPIPGPSPSKVASLSQTKAASPGRTTSITSNDSKAKAEDDLFWGPLDQSKQETRQSVFPSLANPSSLGGNGPSGKGVSGVSLTRQKPAGVGLPSSAADQSFSRGRRDAVSKYSEANDFRDWCESELVKLTGTTDTNFLEFCLKQSTSEAELLLRENLGSLDHNHEFIDKFLNYKDFLAPDVIEMAFGAQNGLKMGGDTPANKDARAARDVDAEGGGKKKGKKGKKVSPAVLGFNVVSNRIMMGEIQTIEE